MKTWMIKKIKEDIEDYDFPDIIREKVVKFYVYLYYHYIPLWYTVNRHMGINKTADFLDKIEENLDCYATFDGGKDLVVSLILPRRLTLNMEKRKFYFYEDVDN